MLQMLAALCLRRDEVSNNSNGAIFRRTRAMQRLVQLIRSSSDNRSVLQPYLTEVFSWIFDDDKEVMCACVVFSVVFPTDRQFFFPDRINLNSGYKEASTLFCTI